MAYRKSKEELLAWSEKYHINLDGLSYNEQCKKVYEFEQANNKPVESENYGEPIAKEKKIKRANLTALPDISKYAKKRILIAPEVAQTKNQTVKYDEELGPELELEEIHYDLEQMKMMDHDVPQTGTYRIKGKKKKRVIAQSTIPKENAAIYFDVGKDMFPVIQFQGKKGYPWTHHTLPNVKEVLMQSGYFEQFRDQFEDTPNCFYLTGLLCCDINKTHSVMNEIERLERMKRKEFK